MRVRLSRGVATDTPTNWVEEAVRAYAAQWAETHAEGELGRDSRTALTSWLDTHIALDGQPLLTDITAEAEGGPWLVLLYEDGSLAILRFIRGEVETRYATIKGATLSESWKWVNDAFELETVIEHDSLPEPMRLQRRSLPRIEPLRELRKKLLGFAAEPRDS